MFLFVFGFRKTNLHGGVKKSPGTKAQRNHLFGLVLVLSFFTNLAKFGIKLMTWRLVKSGMAGENHDSRMARMMQGVFPC